MPVLFSRLVISEMEARIQRRSIHTPDQYITRGDPISQALWSEAFKRTRRSRVRDSADLELNFLYHHYLRLRRFPVLRAQVFWGGRSRI